MVHTDKQFAIATKTGKTIAKKKGKTTRLQFDSDLALTNTVIIYLDGIDADISVAIEMKGNKVVSTWTY